MKTKILTVAILISSCLTTWAWFPPSITQRKVDQIQIGLTTEADLVHLFGAPTTRHTDLAHRVSLDWFRSVPMPITGYLPLIGQFLGGMNVDAQQLSVVVGPDGRVLRYRVNDSKGILKTGPQRVTTMTTTVRQSDYSK